MKTRTFIILMFSAIISCGYAVHASGPSNALVQSESLDTPPGEKIILMGNLMTGTGPNSIEASVTEEAVYVQFNQSFSNVSITIYNGNNLVVYSTVVDTSIQQTVIIPFSAVAADTYTVELNNATGYAEGDFERN